jgi:hypothetical protein
VGGGGGGPPPGGLVGGCVFGLGVDLVGV